MTSSASLIRSAELVGVVRPRADTLALRARRWSAELEKLGIELPLFLVADFGLLLAVPPAQRELGPPRFEALDGLAEPSLAEPYHQLVLEFSETELCREAQSLSLGDDLIVTLLARLFAKLTAASRPELDTLRQLCESRLYLLSVADALDLRAIELLGLLSGELTTGALNVVELLAALRSPEATAIAQFSLQILPSVLEPPRETAVSPHAAFGYAGLSRQGSIDSLVLTELAWDDIELERRLLEHEVLYYAREHGREETKRLHHLLIDASASMRGLRTVFARGMALATAKKLLLSGDDVWLSFFDSRLYEAHACPAGNIPTAHVLAFKGERGRNPQRVFRDLAIQLEARRRKDTRQQLVHLFTHAALYIPRQQVEHLVRLATVAAVFMLPSSGKLELDYLDLLARHWVVDDHALAAGAARDKAAQRILSEIDATGAPPQPARST